MNRKLNVATLLLAAFSLLSILYSFVMPLILLLSGTGASTGIIGGADSPTYLFIYVQSGYLRMTFVGVFFLLSALFIRHHEKNKH